MSTSEHIWSQIATACDAWEALHQLSQAPSPVRFVETRHAQLAAQDHYLDQATRLGAAIIAWIQQGHSLELQSISSSTPTLNTPLHISQAPKAITPHPSPPEAQDDDDLVAPHIEDSEPEPEPEPELEPELEQAPEAESDESDESDDVEGQREDHDFSPPKILSRPPVVTPEKLDALKARLSTNGISQDPLPISTIANDFFDLTARFLPAILSELGPPAPITSVNEAKRELGVLKKVLSDDSLHERWAVLPNDLVKLLSEAVVARARAFQDASPTLLNWCDPHDEVHHLFKKLNQLIQEGRRAYVHGLKLDSSPQHKATWLQEATHHYDALRLHKDQIAPSKNITSRSQHSKALNPERELNLLQDMLVDNTPIKDLRAQIKKMDRGGMRHDKRFIKLLVPHLGYIESASGFSELRRTIRAYLDAQQRTAAPIYEEDDPAQHLNDWPYIKLIREQRVLMVGGQPQEAARQKIAEFFQPASLEWVELTPSAKMRQAQKHCKRIEQGSVDLVLVVQRFISHKASDKIHQTCKKHHVNVVYIEQGYGVEQIKQAISQRLNVEAHP